RCDFVPAAEAAGPAGVGDGGRRAKEQVASYGSRKRTTSEVPTRVFCGRGIPINLPNFPEDSLSCNATMAMGIPHFVRDFRSTHSTIRRTSSLRSYLNACSFPSGPRSPL